MVAIAGAGLVGLFDDLLKVAKERNLGLNKRANMSGLLLVAVGRGPLTAGLGYEEQGVTMDRGFVITNERLATSVPGVYAVGDIVPGLQLAHRGFQQGIFVAEEIAGLRPVTVPDSAVPRVTYCSPEVASVGYTEKQCKEKGMEIKVGKFPFTASGKASAAGAKDGFVKPVSYTHLTLPTIYPV